MVAALENDELIHEAPAIVGCHLCAPELPEYSILPKYIEKLLDSSPQNWVHAILS